MDATAALPRVRTFVGHQGCPPDVSDVPVVVPVSVGGATGSAQQSLGSLARNVLLDLLSR